MTSLAILTHRLEELCEKLDQGELMPLDVLEQFADAKLDHQAKLSSYIAVLDIMRKNAAYYSERAELLARRDKTCVMVEKALKERLVYNIENHPDLPWKTNEGDKLRAQDNPESLSTDLTLDKKSLSNIVVDPSAVDAKYLDVVNLFCLNTDAVKKDLKSGVKLSWARLEKKGKHLRIS